MKFVFWGYCKILAWWAWGSTTHPST